MKRIWGYDLRMSESARVARIWSRSSFLPLLILLAAGTGWGLGVSLNKFGSANGIRPIGYLFWLAVGAGLVSFVICVARGKLPRISREHLRYYFLTAATRTASANFILYTVVQHIPAGVMSVILGTAPIFTYALSLSFRMEPFNLARLIGIVVGLIGVVLFVVPRESLPDPSMAWWVAAALGAPILYAIANIIIDRQRPAEGDSITFAAGMLWASAVLVLPVALLMGDFYVLWPPISWAEIALFTHMAISGLAFFGLFELIRIAGPTYASQLTYIVTLTGILFGMLMFGEVHSIWVWAATAFVLGGVALVNAQSVRSRFRRP